MLALAWLALTALPAGDSTVAGVRTSAPDDPAIQLWINDNRQFREGDQARVQVQARDDGYLVVLHYDTNGRLRILFPLTPADEPFVRGGRRYEVRGEYEDESFITGRDGEGLIYAAVSADPFRLDVYSDRDRWDYTRLSIGTDSNDPEAEITDLLQRVSTDRGFDYDVLSYQVYAPTGYPVAHAWYPRPYYDDFYCSWWMRPSLFGCGYWWPGYYARVGYYSPFHYGYYGGFNPWYRHRYIVYNPNRRWPVVVGRPRGYTIGRRTFGGDRIDNRPGRTFSGSLPRGIDSRDSYGGRTRGRDRPSTARPSGGDRDRSPATSRPRARPSTPDRDAPNIERERGADRQRGPVQIERPRARPVNPERRPSETPNIERERGADRQRGPVQIERPRARPVNPERRPSETPNIERERGNSAGRARPVEVERSRGRAPAPERPAVRAEPRAPSVTPPARARPVEARPRAEPRQIVPRRDPPAKPPEARRSSSSSSRSYDRPMRRSRGEQVSRGTSRSSSPARASTPRRSEPRVSSPRSSSPPRASSPRSSSRPRASAPRASRPARASAPSRSGSSSKPRTSSPRSRPRPG